MITPGKPFVSNYKYTLYIPTIRERTMKFREIEAWAFSNKIRMKMKDDATSWSLKLFFEDDMDFTAFKLVFPL